MLVSKTPGQLGLWLRRELTNRGYDLQRGGQSKFARETGVHVSILSRVLNEDRGVEIDALRRMGAKLGYSLGEMLVFAGLATVDELPARTTKQIETAQPTPKLEPAYEDDSEQHLWETPGLSASQRRQLIGHMQAMRRAEESPGREQPQAEVRELRRRGK